MPRVCPRVWRAGSGRGGCEAGEPGGRFDAELVEDLALARGELGRLADAAGVALQGDLVEPFELAAEVAPGVVCLAFGDASQKSSILVASLCPVTETTQISTGSSPSLRWERAVAGDTRTTAGAATFSTWSSQRTVIVPLATM